MADDDTRPDAGGQDDDATGQVDDNTGGKDDSTGDDGRIVFDSQDELDAMIERRLRRDRRKRNADTAVGKAADKADSSDAADEAARKAAQREADANARVEKAQGLAARAEALVAATDAGLTGDRAKAAVKLADLNLTDVIDDDGEVDAKAVSAAVKATIKSYPFLKADDAPAADTDDTGKPAGVGGKTPKPDGDAGATAITPERFAAMSYTERVQLFNRDPQLYNKLSGVA